jgi:hypothetical protein
MLHRAGLTDCTGQPALLFLRRHYHFFLTLSSRKSMIIMYVHAKGGADMASSDQVKSLIKAHLDQNDEKFKTVILQIAASEAKQGHEIVARELKQYADKMAHSKRNIV